MISLIEAFLPLGISYNLPWAYVEGGGGGGGVWILTEFNDNPLNLYTLLRSFPCIALHILLRTIHCIISTIQNAHVQGIVGFLAMRLSSPGKRMVMYSVEGGDRGV